MLNHRDDVATDFTIDDSLTFERISAHSFMGVCMSLLSLKQREFIPESSKERFIPVQSQGTEIFSDYGITLGGISLLSKGFFAERPKNRNEHILIFTLQGKGLIQTEDGTTYTVEAGDVMISPAQTLGHRHAPLDNFWKIIWIRLQNNANWQDVASSSFTIRKFHYGNDLHDAADNLIKEHVNHEHRAVRLIELYSEMIIIYLQRELSNELPISLRDVRYRLNQLWNSVNANLSYDWNLDYMSEKAGLSRTHFIRLCKKLFQTTPGERVKEMRMNRAESMLLHLDCPVYIISETVGYKNPYAFSAAFHHHFGITPSEYRKKTHSILAENMEKES